MKKKRIPSAIPIYLAALVWLLVGLFAPRQLLRLGSLLATAALSFSAYLLGTIVFKGKTVEVRAKADTGNAEVDRQIEEGRAALERLAALQKSLVQTPCAQPLERMLRSGEAILNALEEDSSRFSVVRRFMNYYLPTVEKIVTDYARLAESPVRGENIRSAMASVEGSLGGVADAFDKQLDALYRDKSFDMDAELTALETILAGEGLAKGSDFTDKDDDSQKIQLGM